MSSLIERVTTTFGGVQADEFHECRQCGTTVDADTDTCPECGSTDIVCYELS
jgi:rubrerythrin